MALKLTRRPEQEITNMALIFRRGGNVALWRFLNQLDRVTLLRLLPPGAGGADQDLRLAVKTLVERRLAHILDGQERVREFMEPEHPDDTKAQRRDGGRLWLKHDMPGSKFKGGQKMDAQQQREVARMSFSRNQELSAKEIREWDKDIERKNKEGQG